MKPNVPNVSSLTSKTKSIYKDESHIMPQVASLLSKMGSSTSTSKCYRGKKSPVLVFHSSKKISLSIFQHLTFSLLMMVVLTVLQLFSYSLPGVECIKSSSFNSYFPYGIHNLQMHATQRNSRLFPNLPINSQSIRDTIPSSIYSKSIRRASKLE